MSGPDWMPSIRPSTRRWLIRGIALTSPVAGIYLAQALKSSSAAVFSGFIENDMALYLAYARQYAEGTARFFYSNPYDWSPGSPKIYFQPFIWILGQLLRILDRPGLVVVCVGLVVTLGAMMTLQRLLEEDDRLPRPLPVWLLVLAAWGGGLLMLGQMLLRRPLDPADGFWFLNLGRNFLYPTEAFYHLLTLTIVWAVLKRRLWFALAIALLLAVSHPFTGLQYGLILLSWAVLESILRSGVIKRRQLVALLLPLALVIGNYLVYLPSFRNHAALMDQWSVNWSMGWATNLAAYGPVAILAGHRIVTNRRKLGAYERFLLVAALVSFTLANHELWHRPVQPLHFTRGHVWLPLFLLGAPSLVALVRWIRNQNGRAGANRVLVLLLFLGLFDNTTFLLYRSLRPTGIFVTRAEQDLVRYMRARDDAPVVISRQRIVYLLPVYSRARPLVSHRHLTPWYAARLEQARQFFDDGDLPEGLESQCVLVAMLDDPLPPVAMESWRVGKVDDWTVLESIAGCSGTRD